MGEDCANLPPEVWGQVIKDALQIEELLRCSAAFESIIRRRALWSMNLWSRWFLTHPTVVALRLVCKDWNAETRLLLKQREFREQVICVEGLSSRISSRISKGSKWTPLRDHRASDFAPWHTMISVSTRQYDSFMPSVYPRANQLVALQLVMALSSFPSFQHHARLFFNVTHLSLYIQNGHPASPYSHPDAFQMLSLYFSQLASLHLQIEIDRPFLTRAFSTEPVLSLPTLHTFSFESLEDVSTYFPDRWNLPRLKHLEMIRLYSRHSPVIKIPFAVNLRSIALRPVKISRDIWTTFSSLEELALP